MFADAVALVAIITVFMLLFLFVQWIFSRYEWVMGVVLLLLAVGAAGAFFYALFFAPVMPVDPDIPNGGGLPWPM